MKRIIALIALATAAVAANADTLGSISANTEMPTAATVNALSGRVTVIETWAIGEDTSLIVDHSGDTNATLAISYKTTANGVETNKVAWSSVVDSSNTVARANTYTDGQITTLATAVDAALDGKANRAWGETSSGGAPAPDDSIVLAKPKVVLTGGGDYVKVESSAGAYYVAAVSIGSTWTMESLADAQNPDNPATLTFYDGNNNPVSVVTSSASRDVWAVVGQDLVGITVEQVNGNDVITIPFAVTSATPPTMYFADELSNEFVEAASHPMVASVVTSGASPAWTNTVTMVGHPGKGFFKGRYVKEGVTYTSYAQPISFARWTDPSDGKIYRVGVGTISGQKTFVLTEDN